MTAECKLYKNDNEQCVVHTYLENKISNLILRVENKSRKKI